MFIRQVIKKFPDSHSEYIQHRLVESIRTPKGPRQRVILNLGTLSIPEDKFKDLANAIEARLGGQTGLFGDNDPEIDGLARHFSELIIRKRLATVAEKSDGAGAADADAADESPPEGEKPRYETVDLNSTATSNARTVGAEHIALTQLKQLAFLDILDDIGFDENTKKHAAAQVIARLAHPSSERETARFLRETSAADELLGADFSRISDNALHRTTDLLLKNKDAIETALAAKSRDLFSLDETLILYDLTNTFFESGKGGSAIARYGKSKEKRADCPLVSLALVIDGKGFPKRSRIYQGNVSEPATLEAMLDELPKYGGRKRTVVIDAGIATEANLELIRKRPNLHYVAVSRKRGYDEGTFDGVEWSEVEMAKGRTLEVKSARVGDEVFLLCKSEERAAKDEAIVTGRRSRFEAELVKLNAGLSKPRTVKKYDKVIERIGRIKERHKVGHLYDVEVKQQDGQAVEVTFTRKESDADEFGEYVIRTDRTDLADGEISSMHRTLTMVEGSFRWLKQDLGLRPNFHQLDRRMEGHIFVTVLAYFVLAPVLAAIGWGGRFIGFGDKDKKTSGGVPDKSGGCLPDTADAGSRDTADDKVPTGWKSIVDAMATMVRVTTSFTCKDGCRMHIRTTCDPTRAQLAVFNKLGVSSRPLNRVVYKEDRS